MDFKDSLPKFELFPRGVPVTKSADLVRIQQLPRRKPLVLDSIEARAMVEYEMRKYALYNDNCECHKIDPQIAAGNRTCIKELLAIQAWALYEMSVAGGLVGSIPVGSGKTALNIMGCLALGETLTLLLVPPGLIEQLILDYQLIAQHFKVPGIIVTTSGGGEWRRLVKGMPVLYVLPYSLLQGKKNSGWIENLQPKAIIADEVDAIKDLGAARTKRIARYFMGNDNMTPEQRAVRSRTKFAGWTGSITDQSILEYAHLAAFALKDKSPVPLDQDTAQEWARCLDALPNPSPPGALISLCNPGEEVRSAYRRRLSETLGFIITGTSNVKITGGEAYVRNNIIERVAPPLPDIVKEALNLVRNFERPDMLGGSKYNEEIVEAMEQARYAQQVSTGMFYKFIFPRGEPDPLKDRWFKARKRYRQEQRYKLVEGLEFMDSPGLLEDAAKRFYGDLPPEPGKPTWKSEAWPEWRDVRDLVVPKTKAVRLHDFLVLDAIDWATSHRGIVWYNMVEFAQWMGQLSGLPVHEGGPRAGANLRKEMGDRSIIASIKSHGRGRNGLQYLFNEQLVAQTPASARIYEQCLDSNTEILTEKGWLGIDSDWHGVKAAAYNIEDGTVLWSEAKRTERKLGTEIMYGIANPHLDIRVTAGHRMVSSKFKHVSRDKHEYEPFQFVEASVMPRIGKIPVAGIQKAQGLPLTDHELTFLGLFMTDGNLSLQNKAISLFQSEKYPQVIKLIEDTLAGCGFNFGHSINYKPSNFGPRSPLHRWAISYGTGRIKTYRGREVKGWSRLAPYVNKEWMPVLDELSAEQLRVFIKALWAGDGSKTQGTYKGKEYNSGTCTIATRRESVANGLQALCVRRGLRCTVSKTTGKLYMIHISEDNSWSVYTKSGDSRPVWGVVASSPDERVWCISVDSGAIITRRNGKVAVVGNCLGRLHRQGQKEAVVTTAVYMHTKEVKKSFEQALRRAEYVRQTMGQDQKILDGWSGDDDGND